MKKTLVIFLTVSFELVFSQSFFEKDWQTVIDTTWGIGLPTTEKLEIFDSIWTLIDYKYACFQNLDVDWNEVRNLYRPEIENGVSHGRFVSILNHMSIKLKETHTIFIESPVNFTTPILPGTPIIRTGGWGLDNIFSAGLIPMPDSSLLVYKVAPNHPLGLETGDVILGYESYPWKFLYKELLLREFPISSQVLSGANDKAFSHFWLTGAGMNWHLFDTIDIKKYSGEIIHLPTNLLVNNSTSIIYSEQLPVPGVPMDTSHWEINWGRVDGSNIGYIYVYTWFTEDISIRFYNALDSLINVFNVEGLIIDLRANTGGYFDRTDDGINLLFEGDVPNLGLAKRSDPFNHFTMLTSSVYNLYPDTNTYFDKPIAVLSGPFCVSAGDFLIKRLKSHPNVKVFGKTSSSAFASAKRVHFNSIIVNYAEHNGFSAENPDQFLTHLEMPVDYEVSFTPEDVRNGDDTVVKTAIEWIKSFTNAIDETSPVTMQFVLNQNYPNPFNPSTKISWQSPVGSWQTLKVYDILGNEVATLVNEFRNAGSYEVDFQSIVGSHQLANGVYFYRLQAGDYVETRKMLLLK